MAAQQQQPRGILKNKHEGGQRPHLTWDEETIAEHDKERGTRMKIDEPDTPYARYDPAEDPDVVQGASPLSPPKELQPVRSTSLDDHLGDLSEKLARAATDSEKPRAALFVEEEERDEAKARAFAQKRQQHYNMAGLLGRKWDEEDEMEDDDAAPPPPHDDAAAPSPPPPPEDAAAPPLPPRDSDDESPPLRLPATGQTGTQWSQWTTGPASQRAASQWASPPPPAWDDALRRRLGAAAPVDAANAACVAYAADERARAALPTMNVSRGDVDVLFAPEEGYWD